MYRTAVHSGVWLMSAGCRKSFIFGSQLSRVFRLLILMLMLLWSALLWSGLVWSGLVWSGLKSSQYRFSSPLSKFDISVAYFSRSKTVAIP